MSNKEMPVQFQDVGGRRHAKVRIPVCINANGEWIADGVWSRGSVEAKRECELGAAECGFGNVVTHIVYALVPVPEGGAVYGSLDEAD